MIQRRVQNVFQRSVKKVLLDRIVSHREWELGKWVWTGLYSQLCAVEPTEQVLKAKCDPDGFVSHGNY